MGSKASKPDVGGAVNAVPKPPTLSEILSQYVSVLPQLIQAEGQYGPQMAQNELNLTKQFTPQFNDLFQAEEQRLYPNTASLQELFAGQAAQGSQEGLSPALLRQYSDFFNANLGSNIGSPIGAGAISKNLIELQEARKDQFRNFGLSLLGRLPAYNPAQVPGGQVTGGFNFGGAVDTALQGYSPFVSATSGLLNTGLSGQYQFRSAANEQKSSTTSSLVKGAASAAAMAAMAMCWVASEIFGGWLKPKTVSARFYVNFIAPKWFKQAYIKHGKKIAVFISDKWILKAILRPLFEVFALVGKARNSNG